MALQKQALAPIWWLLTWSRFQSCASAPLVTSSLYSPVAVSLSFDHQEGYLPFRFEADPGQLECEINIMAGASIRMRFTVFESGQYVYLGDYDGNDGDYTSNTHQGQGYDGYWISWGPQFYVAGVGQNYGENVVDNVTVVSPCISTEGCTMDTVAVFGIGTWDFPSATLPIPESDSGPEHHVVLSDGDNNTCIEVSRSSCAALGLQQVGQLTGVHNIITAIGAADTTCGLRGLNFGFHLNQGPPTAGSYTSLKLCTLLEQSSSPPELTTSCVFECVCDAGNWQMGVCGVLYVLRRGRGTESHMLCEVQVVPGNN